MNWAFKQLNITIYIIVGYQIKRIWVISTHLKLCVATATHNFKWVKIYVLNVALYKD